MPDRDEYIPGVPCWVDTSQPDPEAAARFYSGVFGWEVDDVMPADSEEKYFMARIRGRSVAGIGSLPQGAPATAAWNTYVAVESADDTASKVRDAGGTVLMGPFDVMEAGRMAVLADPEGAAFCIWEANRNPGALIVNEHGTVNFNGLNTRNPDGAKEFYGAVFGWLTIPLPGGVAWTLPGYGDHLERDNPGLRRRLAEMGGPTGFEDVVASLKPIPDNQPDTQPHWDVTFGADDVDEIARKAAELGGEVVAPPFDAPWSRVTVIRDPAGATFIASKFVPENKSITDPADTAASAA